MWNSRASRRDRAANFSEDLRYLEPGDYDVHTLNFSDRAENDLPPLFCDYISMGVHISDEKLLDCLDLMETVVDGGFLFDACTAEGNLQYMLPAVKSVYAKLTERDPLYGKLYRIVSNPNNCVMRYAKDFYSDFHADAAENRGSDVLLPAHFPEYSG